MRSSRHDGLRHREGREGRAQDQLDGRRHLPAAQRAALRAAARARGGEAADHLPGRAPAAARPAARARAADGLRRTGAPSGSGASPACVERADSGRIAPRPERRLAARHERRGAPQRRLRVRYVYVSAGRAPWRCERAHILIICFHTCLDPPDRVRAGEVGRSHEFSSFFAENRLIYRYLPENPSNRLHMRIALR